MGSGASTGFEKALSECTDEELWKTLEGVSSQNRGRLRDAMHIVKRGYHPDTIEWDGNTLKVSSSKHPSAKCGLRGRRPLPAISYTPKDGEKCYVPEPENFSALLVLKPDGSFGYFHSARLQIGTFDMMATAGKGVDCVTGTYEQDDTSAKLVPTKVFKADDYGSCEFDEEEEEEEGEPASKNEGDQAAIQAQPLSIITVVLTSEPHPQGKNGFPMLKLQKVEGLADDALTRYNASWMQDWMQEEEW